MNWRSVAPNCKRLRSKPARWRFSHLAVLKFLLPRQRKRVELSLATWCRLIMIMTCYHYDNDKPATWCRLHKSTSEWFDSVKHLTIWSTKYNTAHMQQKRQQNVHLHISPVFDNTKRDSVFSKVWLIRSLTYSRSRGFPWSSWWTGCFPPVLQQDGSKTGVSIEKAFGIYSPSLCVKLQISIKMYL